MLTTERNLPLFGYEWIEAEEYACGENVTRPRPSTIHRSRGGHYPYYKARNSYSPSTISKTLPTHDEEDSDSYDSLVEEQLSTRLCGDDGGYNHDHSFNQLPRDLTT
ncbi:hypothetical protein ANO14919_096480 [Xylariales sp. No.14919]|nr:hypothetical protein ANO14919_096480 [Xylariales sp. No.14919]